MRPTHVAEGNLLHSVYQFKCQSHPETPRIRFNQKSGHLMVQSSWYIKLTTLDPCCPWELSNPPCCWVTSPGHPGSFPPSSPVWWWPSAHCPWRVACWEGLPHRQPNNSYCATLPPRGPVSSLISLETLEWPPRVVSHGRTFVWPFLPPSNSWEVRDNLEIPTFSASNSSPPSLNFLPLAQRILEGVLGKRSRQGEWSTLPLSSKLLSTEFAKSELKLKLHWDL